MQFIHGNWDHLFGTQGSPTAVRLCFDNEASKLVAMEVRRAVGYVSASSDELADVEDSLKNANGDALDKPESFGLEASQRPPEWAKRYIKH